MSVPAPALALADIVTFEPEPSVGLQSVVPGGACFLRQSSPPSLYLTTLPSSNAGTQFAITPNAGAVIRYVEAIVSLFIQGVAEAAAFGTTAVPNVHGAFLPFSNAFASGGGAFLSGTTPLWGLRDGAFGLVNLGQSSFSLVPNGYQTWAIVSHVTFKIYT